MIKPSIVHIEIPTTDAKKSADFYQALFGWQIQRVEAMNYTMWDPQHGPGGGFSPVGEDTAVGDVLIHVYSEDIDSGLKRAVDLGGTLVRPKTEIPTVGWWGEFKDPNGNRIALFTSLDPDMNRDMPHEHPAVMRDVVHIEIPAVDPKKTGEYYSKLFGWKVDYDAKNDYTFWDAGEGPGGGFPSVASGSKAGNVNIAVNSPNIDADLKKIVSLGGSVMIPKTEIPGMGWYAVFTDPIGNALSLFTEGSNN